MFRERFAFLARTLSRGPRSYSAMLMSRSASERTASRFDSKARRAGVRWMGALTTAFALLAPAHANSGEAVVAQPIAERAITFSAELLGQNRTVVLHPHRVRSSTWFNLSGRTQGGKIVDWGDTRETRSYRGLVLGDERFTAIAQEFDHEVRVAILGDGAIWEGSVTPDSGGRVVFTSEQAAATPEAEQSWSCGNEPIVASGRSDTGRGFAERGSTLPAVAQIGVHIDYRFYESQGSSVANAVAAVEYYTNVTSFIWEHLADIQYELTGVFVETDSATDPFYPPQPSAHYMAAHLQWIWSGSDNTHTPPHAAPPAASFPRDASMLISGHAAIPQPYGGNQSGYAYGTMGYHHYTGYASCSVLTDGAALPIRSIWIQAHEFGHLWSLYHCTGSGCGLMAAPYGIELTPSEVATVVNYRDAHPTSWDAGTVTPLPTLSSLNPASVEVLSAEQISLNGTGLDSTLAVNVLGSRIDFGDVADGGMVLVNSVEVLVDTPNIPIGQHPLVVIGASGPSNSLSLNVVESTVARVAVLDPVILSGVPANFGCAAPIGDVVVLLVSSSDHTTMVNGHDVLRFGTVLDSGVVASTGYYAAVGSIAPNGEYWIQTIQYSQGVMVGASEILKIVVG